MPYRTTGVVIDIEPDSITLEHAPVAALKWPAMTMPFKIIDPTLVRDLKKGQRVEFSFDKLGDDYRITAITPQGAAPTPAAPDPHAGHGTGAASGAPR
jgi:membrane fusion protein, copper/silver efflux system